MKRLLCTLLLALPVTASASPANDFKEALTQRMYPPPQGQAYYPPQASYDEYRETRELYQQEMIKAQIEANKALAEYLRERAPIFITPANNR